MLKQELAHLDILSSTQEAILCFDKNNKITFLTKGAEELFNTTKEESQNKTLKQIHPESHEEIFNILKQRTSIRINIQNQKYHILNSPQYENGEYLGSTVLLIESKFINNAPCQTLSTKNQKRTFHVIRNKILVNLASGKKTINQISITTGINWKTVEKHLTYLLGKKFIDEVYNSEYLRIFELNPKGKEKVEELRSIEQAKLFHKE